MTNPIWEKFNLTEKRGFEPTLFAMQTWLERWENSKSNLISLQAIPDITQRDFLSQYWFWGHQVRENSQPLSTLTKLPELQVAKLDKPAFHRFQAQNQSSEEEWKYLGVHLFSSNDDHYQISLNPQSNFNEKSLNRKNRQGIITTLKDYVVRKYDNPFSKRDSMSAEMRTTDTLRNNLGKSHSSKLFLPITLDKTEKSVDSDSPKNKVAVTGKFSKRFDVVKKTIFRKVKKHLSHQFKMFYDYTKRRRSSKLDYNQEIFNNAENFVKSKFGPDAPEGLAIILVAMIDVKGKYKHADSEFINMRFKLLRLIKHFNLNLMDEIIGNSKYAYLTLHCLRDGIFCKTVLELKTDREVYARYTDQINLLREQCEKNASF